MCGGTEDWFVWWRRNRYRNFTGAPIKWRDPRYVCLDGLGGVKETEGREKTQLRLGVTTGGLRMAKWRGCHISMWFSPDGKYLATGSSDKPARL